MRLLLVVLLSALMLSACQNSSSMRYQIDERATANAPWASGQIVFEYDVQDYTGNASEPQKRAIIRKFLGVTADGYYVAQDFYKNYDQKYADPIVFTQADALTWVSLPSKNYTIGRFVIWYLNGKPQLQGEVQSGKEQGLWIWSSPTGQKEIEGRYKDGLEQGHWREWSANGQLRHEDHYRDGHRYGQSLSWHPNGQKWIELHYNNEGLQEGPQFSWYANGQMASQRNYSNGRPEGLDIGWYENGVKSYERQWHDARAHGLWTVWDEAGRKKYEILYEAGNIVSYKPFD